MLNALLRRILLGIPVIIGVSFASFWVIAGHISALWPLLLNPLAAPLRARLTAKYHLDEPLPVRYWLWLKGLFGHEGFGHTVITNTAIGPEIGSALAHSAILIGLALVLVVPLSVAIGTLSATAPGSARDVTLRGLSYLTWSVPAFLLVIGLQAAYTQFEISTHLHPLAIGGTPGPDAGTGFHFVTSWAQHLALPVLAIALTFTGAYSRYVRSEMLVTLSQPFTTAARAKGLTERRVVLRHALRASLVPFVTALALDFGNLFSTSLVVDWLFGQHGMGALLVNALHQTDPFEVQALIVVAVATVLVATAIGDAVAALLDPRVRRS